MLPDLPSLNTYGGAMRDYAAAVDTTTDEGAIYRNRYVGDQVAIARTAPQAIVSFAGVNNANPTDPASGFLHQAMWGTDPTYKPTFVRSSEGVVDITWPTTVDDVLTDEEEELGGGLTHTVTFRRAMAQVEQSDGTFRAAHAKVTGPNTVRVYCYTGTTLDDLPSQVITVVVW
jgi:hypothetical protein